MTLTEIDFYYINTIDDIVLKHYYRILRRASDADRIKKFMGFIKNLTS